MHIIIHILQVGKLNWRDWVAEDTEIGEGVRRVIRRFDPKPMKVFGLCHRCVVPLQHHIPKTEQPSIKILFSCKVLFYHTFKLPYRFSETITFMVADFYSFKNHLMLVSIHMGRETGNHPNVLSLCFSCAVKTRTILKQVLRKQMDCLKLVPFVQYHRLISQ